MLNKKYWILIILLILIIIFWPSPRDDYSSFNPDFILIKNDSIDQRIDTVTVIIEKVHTQYEKDRDTILNNTPDENYKFFIEYIQRNKERLDSINNL